MDTGSTYSLIPVTKDLISSNVPNDSSSPILTAANGTIINTYGFKSLTLNFGLHRDFTWTFIIADVTRPILGTDFLSHYDIDVNIKRRQITDKLTNIHTDATIISSDTNSTSIICKVSDSPFSHIFDEFPDLCNPNRKLVNNLHHTQHHILTKGPPVSCKPRPLSPEKLKLAKREFQRMMDEGVCRPSSSPWSSPLHLIPKSTPGDWRPCGDYRRLNAITVPDRYPIPNLKDFTYNLSGCTIFSKIDLFRAFNQINVEESSIPKTAISTPFGLFEFCKMGFGMRNSAQTFQRLINEIVGDLPFVFAYIDDLLISSKDNIEHENHLRIVFSRLCKYAIQVNVSKCELGKSQISYLGHTVSSSGIAPLPQKVEAIRNLPMPTTQRKLRQFIGSINFYHRFLPNCASTLAPLNDLLRPVKKGSPISVNWNDDAIKAFHSVKQQLADATELHHPEPTAPLSLTVDASQYAVGSVLNVSIDGQLKPLSFFSKKLSKTECKYSTFGRELLAIYLSVKHFKHILEGRQFTIFTDHKAITYAINVASDNHSPRESRQLSYISQFTSDIQHIPGKQNIVADCLSRIGDTNSISDITINSDSIIKAQTDDTDLPQLLNSTTLNLVKVHNMYVDVNHNLCRPYLPPSLRFPIFQKFHCIAHPGRLRTQKLISHRYVWPNMRSDIASWVASCTICQQSKVSRHSKSKLHEIRFSGSKFDHVHIDIIGPLPPSHDHRYVLTMIDRFSRWPEAIPIKDITSSTVAQAFVSNWISRYGLPLFLTSDRGAQFISFLWKDLMSILGITHNLTTSYHPQSNGMIEKFNKDVKTALKCQDNVNDWYSKLPIIMLSLRCQFKNDLDATSAEYVFGQTLRIPGDLIDNVPRTLNNNLPLPSYVDQLKSCMNSLSYIPPRMPLINNDRIDKKLSSASHVYIRNDHVKPALTRPYSGPYKVIKLTPKYFIVDRKGKPDKISIDRLKPAVIPHDPNANTQYPPVDNDCNDTVFPCRPIELTYPVTIPINNSSIPNSTNNNANNVPNTRPAIKQVRFVTNPPVIHDVRKTRSGRVIKKPVTHYH